ncbi:hypothetical protein IAR50_004609 [Cryptococcus sp. DSM 104548]
MNIYITPVKSAVRKMVVSVTSSEKRETIRTTVNGTTFESEDVTKIFVIEPMPRSPTTAEPASRRLVEDQEEPAKIYLVVVSSVAWAMWLWWALS